MKSFFVLLLFLTVLLITVSAQKVSQVYYNELWQEVKNVDSAKYYRLLWKTKDSLGNKVYMVEEHYVNNVIRRRGSYLDKALNIKNGSFVYYHKNGQIRGKVNYRKNLKEGPAIEYYEDGVLKTKEFYRANQRCGELNVWYPNGALKVSANYVDGGMDGIFKTYYPDGAPLRKDVYLKGQFISGYCFTKSGADTAYFPYIVMPEFKAYISFDRYIRKNMRYPRKGSWYGEYGYALVEFMVDKDGSVMDPTIAFSDDEVINEEVLRVVLNSPKWLPGKIDGVTDIFYLDCAFRLKAK